jgi:hypothetical protein
MQVPHQIIDQSPIVTPRQKDETHVVFEQPADDHSEHECCD